MNRHAVPVAVAVVVLVVSPSGLFAQTPRPHGAPTTSQVAELRVSTVSASIHKAPSTGSPVIGTARRGAVLPVARELGSWLKVAWPEGEDGTGYVHVSSGSIQRGSTAPVRSEAGAVATARPVPQAASIQPAVNADQNVTATQVAHMGTTYVSTPTHLVGLGGRMSGSTLGFGVTGRVWTRDRFGIQLDVSRSAITGTATPGRVTSVQFAPSGIYSLPDRVTDYVWVRPYVGAGGSLNRQTWSSGTPEAADSVSDSTFGFRTFGGAELTFASVPRFAVSADVGYDWAKSAFPGFDFNGLGFAVSGHWYVK